MKIVIKGAGEKATGVAYCLFREGMDVLMTEIENPTTQRRTVSFAEAVYSNKTKVKGVAAQRIDKLEEVERILNKDAIPIFVDPKGDIIDKIKPKVVIDGRMAMKNLGTEITEADLVLGLGPGFEAGQDVDIVIETHEKSEPGKIIRKGSAAKYTGEPPEIKGYSTERVVRSPTEGIFESNKEILDPVKEGETIGQVGEERIEARIAGTLRGIVKSGIRVKQGQKLGDIDPRSVEKYDISDRCLAIGKGVYKAIKKELL